MALDAEINDIHSCLKQVSLCSTHHSKWLICNHSSCSQKLQLLL